MQLSGELDELASRGRAHFGAGLGVSKSLLTGTVSWLHCVAPVMIPAMITPRAAGGAFLRFRSNRRPVEDGSHDVTVQTCVTEGHSLAGPSSQTWSSLLRRETQSI